MKSVGPLPPGHLGRGNAAALPGSQRTRVRGGIPPPDGIGIYYSVRSTADMILYTNVHRQRVRELAKRTAHLFPDLDPEMLERFAAAHDLSKVRSSPRFIAEHGLEEPPAESLRRAWGRDLRKYPHYFERFIASGVNRVDKFIEDTQLERLDIPAELRSRYKQAVRLADLVDRGKAPLAAEEMNKKMNPASEWVRPEEREQVRKIEAEWDRIYGGRDLVHEFLTSRDAAAALSRTKGQYAAGLNQRWASTPSN